MRNDNQDSVFNLPRSSLIASSVDSLKSMHEGLGVDNRDSVSGLHKSLAVTKSQNAMSLAKYLQEQKLPSVAEMAFSAKKEAVEKREKNKLNNSMNSITRKRARAKTSLGDKAEL